METELQYIHKPLLTATWKHVHLDIQHENGIKTAAVRNRKLNISWVVYYGGIFLPPDTYIVYN